MISLFSDSGAIWAIIVAIGYPLLAILMVELKRIVQKRLPEAVKICTLLQVTVLPPLAIFILSSQVGHVAPDGVTSKLLLSILAIASINTCLASINVIMRTGMFSAQWVRQTPELILDIIRLALVLLAAAFVASHIWAVDLGSLLAALGVGSVVLGFALQDTVSGFFAGVSIMSGRHFKEGDWIEAGEVSGRIVHMNWRTITVESLDDNRLIVIPNAELAKTMFTVLTTSTRRFGENILVSFAYTTPPARAMAAIEKAVWSVDLILPEPPHDIDFVEHGPNGMVFELTIHTNSRKEGEEAVTEILRKLWYICQRDGLTLSGAANRMYRNDRLPQMTKAEIVDALASSGMFPEEAPAFELLLKQARFELYDNEELVLAAGNPFTRIHLVVKGELAASVHQGRSPRVVQLVGAGEFFIERAFLTAAPSVVYLRAKGEASVITLEASSVIAFLTANPGLARRFEEAIVLTEAGLANVLSAKG